MKTFFVITFLALASGVFMETCPPEGDIRPCQCNVLDSGDIRVSCSDKSLKDKEVLKRVIGQLSGKQNVELDLKFFPLGRVPSDLFSGVGIKSLDITGCDLDTLADGGPAFSGLEDTLEEITITKSFTGDQVKAKLQLGHLNRLQSLILYYNNITELGDDWFEDGPTSLESVIITDNQIRKVGSNAFAKLVNLKYLFLADNRLRQIERSMFPRPANNLEILNLQNNALTDLPEDIFTEMPALDFLQIEKNGIKKLDEQVWSPIWQQIGWLTLKGNPIRCDDHMSWLFNLHGPKVLTGKCDSPKEQRGKRLEDFIESRSY